jgi:predicted small lipoprotein YifL
MTSLVMLFFIVRIKMFKNAKLLVLLLISLFGLSACGQKGPLYLPDEPTMNKSESLPPPNQQEPR